MEQGYLCMVLHAHLPYVRHPEYGDALEERWYFEAITETYIPLLRAYEALVKDGVDFRITMSLTPPLLAMFQDGLLRARYEEHLRRLVELAHREVTRTQFQPEVQRVAVMYRELLTDTLHRFTDVYHRDLAAAFRRFSEQGKLEIITCGATHGFLPFLAVNPKAVEAQIKVAAAYHRSVLGAGPKGIWLPECGYAPGCETVLAEEGIRYFFTDTHGVLYSNPRPQYGVFAPVYTPAGVAAFGRDLESSRSVWSAQEGYPGDFDYRDFYRDVGFDLDYEYIRPYIHESGVRTFTGLKYHRITGRTDDKGIYNPDAARHKAQDHAGNFLFNRAKQIEYLSSMLDRKPIIVSPYDAELFGHWWFEGPQFIEALMRKTHHETTVVKMLTAREYLERYPKNQSVHLPFSSWGNKGYGEVWLNETNDWIYRHLHAAADRMVAAARRHQDRAAHDGRMARTLNQMARELLLAQSSDWAFIMNAQTMVEYAVRRTKEHLAHFDRLAAQLDDGRIDDAALATLESRDNIFPQIDFRVYA